ncbi:MAG: hypothetical protein IH628_13565 [Proteobacteria bacterium]|nr:hypothetical protein [Pseudomonadota bacterium]
MPLVDLNGAFDLHVHSNPSLFLRSGTDIDMARHAAEHGLAGILVTHPYFNPPWLSVPDQVELANRGASLELCGGNLYPNREAGKSPGTDHRSWRTITDSQQRCRTTAQIPARDGAARACPVSDGKGDVPGIDRPDDQSEPGPAVKPLGSQYFGPQTGGLPDNGNCL